MNWYNDFIVVFKEKISIIIITNWYEDLLLYTQYNNIYYSYKPS